MQPGRAGCGKLPPEPRAKSGRNSSPGVPNAGNSGVCRKNARFRGDKPRGNGRQSLGNCGVRILPLRTASGALLSVAAIGGLLVLAPVSAHAQWWRSAPADFEGCAAQAEKAGTKEDKPSRLSECNAKFAGRRKTGGGYSYYDFMQNRNFDIAGPNPTPEEQKKIDEEYINYLERERRNSAANALAAKPQEQQQQQPQQLQAVALRSDEKVPVPVASPAKQQARAAGDPPPRTRSRSGCVKGT